MIRTTAAIMALAWLLLPQPACAQAERDPSVAPVYRVIGGDTLLVHVFLPPEPKSGLKADAILLFHGGGWNAGEPLWTFAAARQRRTAPPPFLHGHASTPPV